MIAIIISIAFAAASLLFLVFAIGIARHCPWEMPDKLQAIFTCVCLCALCAVASLHIYQLSLPDKPETHLK